MAIDREETLRKAEKLLRQGRLDVAITEYARVAETHPGDLVTVNKLGELYQRAGQIADAITCYGRVADHWLVEGLHAKAASHYKKILKLNPSDESAMLQLVEATAQQGLLPEAKKHLLAARERRLANGDARGADELTLRLADLDPMDFEARLAGLKIRVRDNPEADLAPVLRDAIAELDRLGRSDEADAMALSVIELDPDDVPTLVRAARSAIKRGDHAAARALLPDPATSDSYDIVLIAAELALTETADADGSGAGLGGAARRREWFERLLTLDRARAATNLAEFGDRLVAQDADAAYACIEVLADHHAVAAEFRQATDLVTRFLEVAAPPHLPALLRLVELCVDGDFEAELTDAQGRLADVYLDVGQPFQARVIAEDLLSRDPKSAVQRDRLHRALVTLGESDPEAIIADLLGFAEESIAINLPTAAPARPLIPELDEPDFAGGVSASPTASIGVESSLDGLETPWDADEGQAFAPADLGALAPPEPPPPAPAPSPTPAIQVAPPPAIEEPPPPVVEEPPLASIEEPPASVEVEEPPPSVEEAPAAAAEQTGSSLVIELPGMHNLSGSMQVVVSPLFGDPLVLPDTPMPFEPVVVAEPRATAEPASAPEAASVAEPAAAPESESKAKASRPRGKVAEEKRVAEPTTPPPAPPPPAPPVEAFEDLDLSAEIDLTAALDALSQEGDDDVAAAESEAEPTSAPSDASNGRRAVMEGFEEDEDEAEAGEDDLEAVFEGLRERAADDLAELPQTDQSARLLGMAETYQAAGMIDEAESALEQAAGDLRYRFKAALALGRLLWREGRTDAAIGWLGRASEAPAPTAEDSRAVLYELAERLEDTGETTRALAVLLDLVAEQEDYRDARARIDRLVRVQAERR